MSTPIYERHRTSPEEDRLAIASQLEADIRVQVRSMSLDSVEQVATLLTHPRLRDVADRAADSLRAKTPLSDGEIRRIIESSTERPALPVMLSSLAVNTQFNKRPDYVLGVLDSGLALSGNGVMQAAARLLAVRRERTDAMAVRLGSGRLLVVDGYGEPMPQPALFEALVLGMRRTDMCGMTSARADALLGRVSSGSVSRRTIVATTVAAVSATLLPVISAPSARASDGGIIATQQVMEAPVPHGSLDELLNGGDISGNELDRGAAQQAAEVANVIADANTAIPPVVAEVDSTPSATEAPAATPTNDSESAAAPSPEVTPDPVEASPSSSLPAGIETQPAPSVTQGPETPEPQPADVATPETPAPNEVPVEAPSPVAALARQAPTVLPANEAAAATIPRAKARHLRPALVQDANAGDVASEIAVGVSPDDAKSAEEMQPPVTPGTGWSSAEGEREAGMAGVLESQRGEIVHAARMQFLKETSWELRGGAFDDPGHTVARAYLFFLDQGFNAQQAAGILGSLGVESGGVLDPHVKQTGGGPGRGIAQWTERERFQDLKDYAKRRDLDPYVLETQLQFVMYEMTHVAPWDKTLPALKRADTIREATYTFERLYEKAGAPALGVRERFGRQVYERYQDALKDARRAAVQSAQPRRVERAKPSGWKVAGDPDEYRQSQARNSAPRTPIKGELLREGYKNGRLDGKVLDRIGDTWGDIHLHKDAAAAFREMNVAFEAEFGKPLQFSGSRSGYRSHAQQIDIKAEAVHRGRPQMAAAPGHSNHGWGLAVDLKDMGNFDSREYNWMLKNAIRFGFVHPAFAAEQGRAPEAWHWEYNAPKSSTND